MLSEQPKFEKLPTTKFEQKPEKGLEKEPQEIERKPHGVKN